jgi:alkylated DNA nucleotide flippase Atl1
MAHNATTPVAAAQAASPATINPQDAARAALQAALAALPAGNCPNVATVLAKLQPGRAYTLRQVAQACGYSPAKRSNGRTAWQPLRRTMRTAAAQGKVVAATVGGYTGANGIAVGGKAYYMLVANG